MEDFTTPAGRTGNIDYVNWRWIVTVNINSQRALRLVFRERPSGAEIDDRVQQKLARETMKRDRDREERLREHKHKLIVEQFENEFDRIHYKIKDK